MRSIIGLAGQYAAVDENLTGRENLEMVGNLNHMRRSAVPGRAKELLAQFGLEDAGDRVLKTYSGGMRRRLDLAAALVARPTVLFLDEPTTGLDPQSRNDLWEVIEQLVGGGTTVLLTTQYLEEADRLADTLVVLDHGRVIAEGTPARLKANLGATVLEIGLGSIEDAQRARGVLDALGSHTPSVNGTVVEVTVDQGPEAAMASLRSLDQQQIVPTTFTLREPSLDDVFLALTGRRAEEGTEDAPTASRPVPSRATPRRRPCRPGQGDDRDDHRPRPHRRPRPAFDPTRVPVALGPRRHPDRHQAQRRQPTRASPRRCSSPPCSPSCSCCCSSTCSAAPSTSPGSATSTTSCPASSCRPSPSARSRPASGWPRTCRRGSSSASAPCPWPARPCWPAAPRPTCVRNVFTVVIITAVGLIVGFRPTTGALSYMAGILLILLFAYAISWGFAVIGLSAPNSEVAQVMSFPLLFPLTFASSAFVPVSSMPGWLQGFATYQPVSVTVSACRALMIGGPTATWVIQSLLWSLGLLVVLVPLAVRRYRTRI